MKTTPTALKAIIKDILHELYQYPYIMEGIDIDNENKIVSFNPTHENNIDTSVLLNPTYSKINDINVISIFKRKDNENKTDGNPLIYALKGIKGWKFKNQKEDIIGLLQQFIRISEKIDPVYDTIITIPSNNPLNTHFLYHLNKLIRANKKVTDYLSKLTSDEVWDDYINWKQIHYDFPNKHNKIKAKLLEYFKDMKSNNEDYFSFKYIKDLNYRKYITKTMHSDKSKFIEYAPFINDKNILILDDTIASGQSISEACAEILDSFAPVSITVITLFSSLQ